MRKTDDKQLLYRKNRQKFNGRPLNIFIVKAKMDKEWKMLSGDILTGPFWDKQSQ